MTRQPWLRRILLTGPAFGGLVLVLIAGCQSDCGDGILCPETEECDDGNLIPGDGCDQSCRIEGSVCGDGRVEGDEACDDGFTDACGTCNEDCTDEGSGFAPADGVVCPEFEQCNVGEDDPNLHDENCASIVAVCGNGVLEPGEFCDDGYTDACGTCNEDCSGPGVDAETGTDAIAASAVSGLLTSIVNSFLAAFISQFFSSGGR